MNICCITIIKPYFCTHEKETIIHRGSVGCLLRARSNRHHLALALPQETDTEPGEKPTGSPAQATACRYAEEETCEEDGFQYLRNFKR